MNELKLKIKYEGKVLVEKVGNSISDFDPIIDGLREKFDGKKRNKHG
jgi:hypothetical protein